MNKTIKNNRYTLTVSSRGAEIQEFADTASGRKIVWQGDRSVWAWNAPICFPFCGKLKDNWCTIGGARYDFTNNHGFIREQTHTLLHADEKSMEWESKSNEETKKLFPFDYAFKTYYELTEKSLIYRCTITNTGAQTMYYSFGTHTAFCTKQDGENAKIGDYCIEFEQDESFTNYYDSGAEGYKTRPLTAEIYPPLASAKAKNQIPLSDKGFGSGLLLTNLRSSWAGLRNSTTGVLTKINIKGFPIVVLWQNTSGEPQFVCIEPWAGASDSSETNRVFEQKPQICTLQAGKSITYDQTISE